MRTLVALLIIVVGLFLVVGWYNDWFNIKTGNNKVELTYDPAKMKDDVNKGKDAIKGKSTELMESAKDKFGKKDTATSTSSVP
jgi:hypothetical protein